jgi:hypothetical protein
VQGESCGDTSVWTDEGRRRQGVEFQERFFLGEVQEGWRSRLFCGEGKESCGSRILVHEIGDLEVHSSLRGRGGKGRRGGLEEAEGGAWPADTLMCGHSRGRIQDIARSLGRMKIGDIKKTLLRADPRYANEEPGLFRMTTCTVLFGAQREGKLKGGGTSSATPSHV